MLKKAKVGKAIIAVIAWFSFIHWGLDPKFICKVVSETPQTCGYAEPNVPVIGAGINFLKAGLHIVLGTMAATLLALWVSKD